MANIEIYTGENGEILLWDGLKPKWTNLLNNPVFGDIKGTIFDTRLDKIQGRDFDFPKPTFLGDDFENGSTISDIWNEPSGDVTQSGGKLRLGLDAFIQLPQNPYAKYPFYNKFFEFTIDDIAKGVNLINEIGMSSGAASMWISINPESTIIYFYNDSADATHEITITWDSPTKIRFYHDAYNAKVGLATYKNGKWTIQHEFTDNLFFTNLLFSFYLNVYYDGSPTTITDKFLISDFKTDVVISDPVTDEKILKYDNEEHKLVLVTPKNVKGLLAVQVIEDDFEDGSISDLWKSTTYGGGSVVETGGQMVLSAGSDSADGSQIQTQTLYGFKDSFIEFGIGQIITGTDFVNDFSINTAGHYFYFFIMNGNLNLDYDFGGGEQTPSFEWDNATKIRVTSKDGKILLDTHKDGIWTNKLNVDEESLFSSINKFKIAIDVYSFDASHTPTGSLKLDYVKSDMIRGGESQTPFINTKTKQIEFRNTPIYIPINLHGALVVGDRLATVRAPYSDFVPTQVIGSLGQPSTVGAVEVAISVAFSGTSGIDLFSTNLTIDQDDFTSLDATIPPVINFNTVGAYCEFSIYIIHAGVGASDLNVWVVGYLI